MFMPQLELFVLTIPVRNISNGKILFKKITKNQIFFQLSNNVQSKYMFLRRARFYFFFLKRYALAM